MSGVAAVRFAHLPSLRARGRSLNMSASCSASPPDGLSDGCRGAPLVPGAKLPLPGDEKIMSAKAHGTCDTPVQSKLRWGCDTKLADRICWCAAARHANASRRPARL